MRKFAVGDLVTCTARGAASGNYKIVGTLPDREGDYVYRIKSPLEECERAVKEDLLVKSAGHFVEEIFAPRRHPAVTLPKLQSAYESNL
jgi:hypothetical protein